MAQMVKTLPAILETRAWTLDQEDSLEKRMIYPLQCSCLENSMDWGAWWLQSVESQRVGHDWATETHSGPCPDAQRQSPGTPVPVSTPVPRDVAVLLLEILWVGAGRWGCGKRNRRQKWMRHISKAPSMPHWRSSLALALRTFQVQRVILTVSTHAGCLSFTSELPFWERWDQPSSLPFQRETGYMVEGGLFLKATEEKGKEYFPLAPIIR